MIKDSNIQKSIVISRKLWEKLAIEAQRQYYGTTSQLVRKILADYIESIEKGSI